MSFAISELIKNKKLLTAVNTLQAVIRSTRRVHFKYGRTIYSKRKTLTRLSDDHNYHTNKYLETISKHILRPHKRSYVLMAMSNELADPVLKSHRRPHSLSIDPGPVQLLALPFFNQKKGNGYEFLMATLITLGMLRMYCK